ncbi:hypothetical protein [Microbacterium candidum]|uniref:Integral membrane protein n=1 Tax=Microbacterium candidum TaxID=3041922 RepID=A0ABT7MX36_9MICO|nr:hypothetical protein [Microbacterium sp. ASV49]MDL9979007.1 hypothetical protein [Microbacterium sp. ASV49]
MADTPAQTPQEDHPEVLELRVHGVNSTYSAALLDLGPADVEEVMGDDLGSFWRPLPSTAAKLRPGERGYVPPGIRREAYSWGGMVRTTPNLGGTSTIGTVTSILARIGYVLLLPFALANVAQWTWRLPDAGPKEGRALLPAGLNRVFGLLLTLLFTTTAATLGLDLGAAQCAADASRCGNANAFFAMFASWSAPDRMALFALIPILAAGLLWMLANLSRQRYDVLPGMAGHKVGAEEGLVPETEPPTALLSNPGFWSNRITRHLAHAHFAGAIFLTITLVGAHAAFRWSATCVGLGHFTVCTATAWRNIWFDLGFALTVLGLVGLIATVVIVFLLPTTAVTPIEQQKRPLWTARAGGVLLGASAVLFLLLEVYLLVAWFRPGIVVPMRLYGAGTTPLIIVTAAAVIALSGVFWRSLRPRAAAGASKPASDRRATAWHGCGPAAFMTFALVTAVSTSAIITVTVGTWLNGKAPAAALVDGGRISISASYVAIGSCIVVGLVIFLAIAGGWLALPALRGPSAARAADWNAPMDAAQTAALIPDGAGVLPPSSETVYSWIERQRSLAARVHMAEPVGAIGAVALGAAVAVGVVWAWLAYGHSAPLWDALNLGPVAVVHAGLNMLMASLGWIGLALVAMLAAGATHQSARPVAIVWDVICYLPRTGHPFGPPAYAERAVPEIAGRLFEWLNDRPDRRAVLVGHSMGSVLVVSALGLLGSSPATRDVLPRLRLITFGAQLRVFFGRIFPELLGPDVLGTQPSRAPILRGPDPWARDFQAPVPASASGNRLRGDLLPDDGVRWVNLWRATDMLGWPVKSSHANHIDRYAEELDLSGYMPDIGGHDAYYRVPAYAQAMEELRQTNV